MRCFMLTFFLAPLFYASVAPWLFSHFHSPAAPAVRGTSQTREGGWGGLAVSVGGVASHDSKGMSACPWEGRRRLATNFVFVFPSVCLCLVPSHNFALSFLPPFPRLSEGTNFFSENFPGPQPETSARAVAQDLKHCFLPHVTHASTPFLHFGVFRPFTPPPLSCSLARSHTCAGAFPRPPHVIPVMLSHSHMENSFTGSSHLLRRLSPWGPTQCSLMEKYRHAGRNA